MKRYTNILFFLVIIQFSSYGQGITPKFTFNVELGLPVAMSNKPYDEFMQGLVAASTYGQYTFPFHLNVGLGVRYSYFTINEFSVPTPVYGGTHIGTAFAKIGWDKFHTEQFATDFGLKFGYSQNYFVSDLNKLAGNNPVQINSSFGEFTAAAILAASERGSFRWVVGYGFQGFGFRPQHIGINSSSGFDPGNFNTISSYLVVGFGYTYYFRSGGAPSGETN